TDSKDRSRRRNASSKRTRALIQRFARRAANPERMVRSSAPLRACAQLGWQSTKQETTATHNHRERFPLRLRTTVASSYWAVARLQPCVPPNYPAPDAMCEDFSSFYLLAQNEYSGKATVLHCR